MVNVNLVCQSVPKEPLQARVSKGAVATAITACGFVTNSGAQPGDVLLVATAITACGFVTVKNGTDLNDAKSCNSDYRLRFCNKY